MKDYGVKTVTDQRLVWWKAQANEDYWYNHFAGQIDSTFALVRSSNSRLITLLEQHLPKQGRILEAGCGTGWLVAALQCRGYAIEGVDYSRALVQEVLQKFPSLPIRTGDVCELDVPDNFYSGYVSLGVIEHRQEGYEPFLREAWRVVAPKGTLCISVPFFNPLRQAKYRLGCFQEIFGELEFYQYGFTKNFFKTALQEHGFKVRAFEFYGTLRCIEEEIPWLDRILRRRGIWRLRRYLSLLDSLEVAAHMVMAVAEKPG